MIVKNLISVYRYCFDWISCQNDISIWMFYSDEIELLQPSKPGGFIHKRHHIASMCAVELVCLWDGGIMLEVSCGVPTTPFWPTFNEFLLVACNIVQFIFVIVDALELKIWLVVHACLLDYQKAWKECNSFNPCNALHLQYDSLDKFACNNASNKICGEEAKLLIAWRDMFLNFEVADWRYFREGGQMKSFG